MFFRRKTVSYTHLDVYKRQGVQEVKEMMENLGVPDEAAVKATIGSLLK